MSSLHCVAFPALMVVYTICVVLLSYCGKLSPRPTRPDCGILWTSARSWSNTGLFFVLISFVDSELPARELCSFNQFHNVSGYAFPSLYFFFSGLRLATSDYVSQSFSLAHLDSRNKNLVSAEKNFFDKRKRMQYGTVFTLSCKLFMC